MSSLLAPKEAAERLSVSVRTLTRWATQGDIDAVKLPSGRYKYDPAVIDQIRASGTKAAS